MLLHCLNWDHNTRLINIHGMLHASHYLIYLNRGQHNMNASPMVICTSFLFSF
ncbi:hypothetical protein Hanom_Chr10g00907481 [Helianthus anomalus]